MSWLTGYIRIQGLIHFQKYAWKIGLGYDPGSGSGNSTGIEIEETTVGQVYSSVSYINLVSSLSKYDLEDMLEAGEYIYAPSLGRVIRALI